MGRAIGDEIEVATPGGLQHYKILAVQ